MISGPAFPIHFAHILFAEVLDPNGRNPKMRRVAVLTPDDALTAGFPIVVAGITGTLPTPLTEDFVALPYRNPPGHHPVTGLNKKAAVLCTWLVALAQNEVRGWSGIVPPRYMKLIEAKTAAQAKIIGGWR